MSTGIEWTDETWNPTTGCDRVSPGCDNCYALTMAARLKGMGQPKYQTDGDPRTSGAGFGLAMHADVLDQPFRWRKPRKVFVNSMSDLFHPKVSDGFIGSVWRTMALTPQHTYQVLTKRPKRARALLNQWTEQDGMWRDHRGTWQQPQAWPLPNVWLGTSVEDQQRADERVPALIETPAAVRFLSCEPLLGQVDLTRYLWLNGPSTAGPFYDYAGRRRGGGGVGGMAITHVPAGDLHWVIVGGESGPGARPMDVVWARSLRDQCFNAEVAFHFKQWGAWVDIEQAPQDTFADVDAAVNLAGNPQRVHRVGKKAAGRLLDGRTWDEFPQAVPA